MKSSVPFRLPGAAANCSFSAHDQHKIGAWMQITANKAKTALSATSLAAALLASPSATQNANAEVLFTMDSSNGAGFPSRIFGALPFAHTLQLLIYAENTSPEDKVSGLQWEIKMPEELEYLGRRGLTYPYIIVNDSHPETRTNDFFYPKPMDEESNYLGNPHGQTKWPAGTSSRFTKQGSTRPPVEKSEGIIGLYYFEIPRDCPLGNYTFHIVNPKAFNPQEEPIPARGTQMTIKVVPDKWEYYASNKFELIQDTDTNGEDNYLYLPPYDALPNGQNIRIKATSDFRNWDNLATNEIITLEPPDVPYYAPLHYIDRGVRKKHSMRFYVPEVIE